MLLKLPLSGDTDNEIGGNEIDSDSQKLNSVGERRFYIDIVPYIH